jgi:hypothetical protein
MVDGIAAAGDNPTLYDGQANSPAGWVLPDVAGYAF